MKIQDCIRLFENKLLNLQEQKALFERIGDIQAILEKEQEIEDVKSILQKLQS